MAQISLFIMGLGWMFGLRMGFLPADGGDSVVLTVPMVERDCPIMEPPDEIHLPTLPLEGPISAPTPGPALPDGTYDGIVFGLPGSRSGICGTTPRWWDR